MNPAIPAGWPLPQWPLPTPTSTRDGLSRGKCLNSPTKWPVEAGAPRITLSPGTIPCGEHRPTKRPLLAPSGWCGGRKAPGSSSRAFKHLPPLCPCPRPGASLHPLYAGRGEGVFWGPRAVQGACGQHGLRDEGASSVLGIQLFFDVRKSIHVTRWSPTISDQAQTSPWQFLHVGSGLMSFQEWKGPQNPFDRKLSSGCAGCVDIHCSRSWESSSKQQDLASWGLHSGGQQTAAW